MKRALLMLFNAMGAPKDLKIDQGTNIINTKQWCEQQSRICNANKNRSENPINMKYINAENKRKILNKIDNPFKQNYQEQKKMVNTLW